MTDIYLNICARMVDYVRRCTPIPGGSRRRTRPCRLSAGQDGSGSSGRGSRRHLATFHALFLLLLRRRTTQQKRIKRALDLILYV